jgi:GDPmannose 4,6-dehydratase
MKALAFGANGQDGHYLGILCREKGIEPLGVSRAGEGIRGDVPDYTLVESLVWKHRPAYIFHLAANSTTCHSTLFENYATISTATHNILEAVRLHSEDTRVFIAGSGIQFRNSGLSISEYDPFDAISAYFVTRIHAVNAARYFRCLGSRRT